MKVKNTIEAYDDWYGVYKQGMFKWISNGSDSHQTTKYGQSV